MSRCTRANIIKLAAAFRAEFNDALELEQLAALDQENADRIAKGDELFEVKLEPVSDWNPKPRRVVAWR